MKPKKPVMPRVDGPPPPQQVPIVPPVSESEVKLDFGRLLGRSSTGDLVNQDMRAARGRSTRPSKGTRSFSCGPR